MEIYALLDPRNSHIRYVGQSRNARKRRNWHVNAAKRGVPGYIYNWLRTVLRSGGSPVLTVLETCSETDVDAKETAWIARKRKEGAKLTNCTEGGGGIRGWTHSLAAKDKIGAAHRGKVLSPRTLAKLAAAQRGKKHTQETREKIGQANRGKVLSERTRALISLSNLGNKNPLGCKRSPKTLAKMRAASAKGGQNPRSKVSDGHAVEIRQLFSEGVRQCALARMFNTDPVCIHRIVRGKTYK